MLERLLSHPAEAVALLEDGVPTSYGALRARAAALASRLPEGAVAVHAAGGAWALGVLACAWRGAPFCPIDPSLPRARRALMVEEAGVAAVLSVTDPGLGVPWISLDVEVLELGAAHLPPAPFDPERLAWLIFTSGSSGRPKAVEVPWRFVPTLIAAQVEAIGLGPGDRALLLLNPGFDAAQSDLWCALWAGATLVVEPGCQSPEGLLAALRRREIHYVDMPPALLRRLDPADRPASLRCVLIGGEVCPAPVVRAWAAVLRLLVVYGPTEATVCSSMAQADATWDRPWIGQPLPGVRYRVVDAAGEEASEGELLIGGPGLARGYRGRPELTASRFVVLGGERWHRSGDRINREADEYCFLGRLDRQVKLAGRRVELEEIEAVLSAAPGVARAAVVVVEGRLWAVVEGVVETAALAAADVEAWCRERLPGWMCPRVQVGVLPVVGSGKVDLAAVRGWFEDEGREGAALGGLEVSAEAAAAELLCALWSRVLAQPVRPDSSLQALGADSVSVLELTAAAEARGLALSPALWLSHDSVAAALSALGPDPGRDAASLRPQGPDLRARPSPTGPAGHLLLTGATGGLGGLLLPRLLERFDGRVTCLVRAPDDEAAAARLPLQHPRVQALRGDLAAPALGLAPAAWAQLADEVDGVVHCGARVHLLASAEALWAPNVDGARRVLELVGAGRPKRLHLISTLSVFVASERNTGLALESDDLSSTQRLWGGYAQTKFAAEQLCASSGLEPMAIYRLGLLVGAGDGDLLPRLLRGLIELGVAPRGALSLELDLTPAVDAAEALAQLICDDARGTFHLAARRPASLEMLVEALRAEGHAIELTENEAFTARVAQARSPDASAAALALCRRLDPEGFAALRSLDLFQATGVRFDMRRAEAALGRAVCAAPSVESLRALVRGALVRRGAGG